MNIEINSNKENKSIGLWQKTAKSGKKYYSGSVDISGQKFYISLFKNENKKNEKAPDLNMVITPANKENVEPADPYKPIPDDKEVPF